MNIEDFIQHFADQFDDTDFSVFTPETRFKELDEWSSLIALSVIAMADKFYHKRIKGSEVQQVDSIRDLFNLINSK